MSNSRDIADSAATINYIDGLTSDAQTQIDTKAPLATPTFTGTVTATAFSGDGSGLTGVDSLPSQTGNAGEFLTTDGTNPSWAEAGGGAWELLATYTPSSASTVNVEAFSSTYDDYVIIGTLTSASAIPRIRVKLGSGSYATGSYAWHQQDYNSFNNNGASTQIEMGGDIGSGSSQASIKMSFITNCFNVNDSTYQGVFGTTNNATGFNMRGIAYSGYYYGAAGILTGVQYSPNSGSYTGTVRIYGIKKT